MASLGASREASADERILGSALERKNVTVVRLQGEEKLAVARHWPKPRRRSERFLFARTCFSVRLDDQPTGQPASQLATTTTGLLSPRFSSSPRFCRGMCERLFSSSLEEGTGPGKLPRTGDLSTGKLSRRATSLWNFKGCLSYTDMCALLENEWMGVIGGTQYSR